MTTETQPTDAQDETIIAADGSEHNKAEVALNECRRDGEVMVRFVNDDSPGVNFTVTENAILTIDADRIAADVLDVDTDAIINELEEMVDGRKVASNARYATVYVDERHGVVVDANVIPEPFDDADDAEARLVEVAN